MATQTVPTVYPPRRVPERVLNGEVLEHYRTLVCQTLGLGSEGASLLRTLGVASCRRGEGASTVAAHLAITAAAATNRRVLLVDGDWTAPTLHLLMGCQRKPGLREAVGRPEHALEWVHESDIPHLSFLPAGGSSADGERAWDGQSASAFLETVRCEFALVVFALPAGLAEHSALQLASLLDGVLVVIEAESTPRETALQLKALAAGANVNLLGAVLNQRRR